MTCTTSTIHEKATKEEAVQITCWSWGLPETVKRHPTIKAGTSPACSSFLYASGELMTCTPCGTKPSIHGVSLIDALADYSIQILCQYMNTSHVDELVSDVCPLSNVHFQILQDGLVVIVSRTPSARQSLFITWVEMLRSIYAVHVHVSVTQNSANQYTLHKMSINKSGHLLTAALPWRKHHSFISVCRRQVIKIEHQKLTLRNVLIKHLGTLSPDLTREHYSSTPAQTAWAANAKKRIPPRNPIARSLTNDAKCRPPSTAAPVQIPCPRIPPNVTPTTPVEAASPIVAICRHKIALTTWLCIQIECCWPK